MESSTTSSSCARGSHRSACCGATFDSNAAAAACPASRRSRKDSELTMAENDSPYSLARSTAMAPYLLDDSSADLAASAAGPSPRASARSSKPRSPSNVGGPQSACFLIFSGSGGACERTGSLAAVPSSSAARRVTTMSSLPSALRTSAMSRSRYRSFASQSVARPPNARWTCDRNAANRSGWPRGNGSGGGNGVSLSSSACSYTFARIRLSLAMS
mmetsp:Transcript_93449/g.269925  ORF Transcript_93449/g.269925 Transcript_93449/m.269925 type:complete len:216 (+) Transcript_93449:633-1280(+)